MLLTPFGSADLDFSTLGTDSLLMISLNERKQGVQSVSLQCDLHRKRRFAEHNFSYGLFARLSDQTGDNQIIELDDQAGADTALRWCCVAMPSTATSMRKPAILGNLVRNLPPR